jgi:hypothetical protein
MLKIRGMNVRPEMEVVHVVLRDVGREALSAISE